MTNRKVPISGGAGQYRPSPDIPTNSADTSRDAEKMISRAPSPFASPYSTVNVPAPPNQNFSRDQIAGLPSPRGLQPSKQGGQATQDFSITKGTGMSAEQYAAVGCEKPKGKK